MDRWQEEWNASTKGRWTHRLIKYLKAWIGRKHGMITFRMTQCLSGHGVFYNDLKEINRAESGACIYCSNPKDDAEHTLFECQRWQQERETLRHELQDRNHDISVENIIGKMIDSREGWEYVRRFMESVIRQKEQDERRAQGTR
jgi:hypothetical protein